MRINNILKRKYNSETDLGNKITSTSICLAYDRLIQESFPKLSFSKAKSIRNNVLNVQVEHYLQAQELKFYEFEIKEKLNNDIRDDKYSIDKIYVRINNI